jgi:hypothetical protein
MDSLVSGVKKFIKAYGKEKDMRTSTVQVTQLFMLKTNLISQRNHQSLERQIQSTC